MSSQKISLQNSGTPIISWSFLSDNLEESVIYVGNYPP